MARKEATERLTPARSSSAIERASAPEGNVTAVEAEVDLVRQDEGFMSLLRAVVERDEEVLRRLAGE